MKLETFWDIRRYREETDALAKSCDGVDDGRVLIAADFGQPHDVIARLIAARRAGELVALYPVLSDPLETLLADIARSIASNGVDERVALFDALRNDAIRIKDQRPADMAKIDDRVIKTGTFACKLADVVVFVTDAERRRWREIVGRELVRFVLLPLEPAIPRAASRNRHIVVYAPSIPRERLVLTESALQGQRWTVDVIAAGDERPIPARAAVVVCPEWWRPLLAARVAQSGIAVVAPDRGGAHERGVAFGYTPTDVISLRRAVDAALNDALPQPSLGSGTVREALDAQAPTRTGGPLVSVIVRTFDRPKLLEAALASIAAQTYRPVEAVVVNGGGPDVRASVQQFSDRIGVTYVDTGRRTTISESANYGVRAAQGEYIAYLDDDDLFYPDHLSRSVEALERTELDLAYTNCVAEYADMNGDQKLIGGYSMYLDRDFDRDRLYIYNIAPINSIVHRRDVFERFGYFDESFPVVDDWEMWLRVGEGGDFTHVDRATCEYSWRFDPKYGNMTLLRQRDFLEAHGRIYAMYAAVLADRPRLRAEQSSTLDFLRHRLEILDREPHRARELLFSTDPPAQPQPQPPAPS